MSVQTLEFPGSVPKEESSQKPQNKPSLREKLRAKVMSYFNRGSNETPQNLSRRQAGHTLERNTQHPTSSISLRREKKAADRQQRKEALKRDDELRLNRLTLERLKAQGKAPKGAEI